MELSWGTIIAGLLVVLALVQTAFILGRVSFGRQPHLGRSGVIGVIDTRGELLGKLGPESVHLQLSRAETVAAILLDGYADGDYPTFVIEIGMVDGRKELPYLAPHSRSLNKEELSGLCFLIPEPSQARIFLTLISTRWFPGSTWNGIRHRATYRIERV